ETTSPPLAQEAVFSGKLFSTYSSTFAPVAVSNVKLFCRLSSPSGEHVVADEKGSSVDAGGGSEAAAHPKARSPRGKAMRMDWARIMIKRGSTTRPHHEKMARRSKIVVPTSLTAHKSEVHAAWQCLSSASIMRELRARPSRCTCPSRRGRCARRRRRDRA